MLKDNPLLSSYRLPAGECIEYKGRKYAWLNIDTNGKIKLTEPLIKTLQLSVGDKLLTIRSSNIAFTMGHKGPLIESAKEYLGEIKEY